MTFKIKYLESAKTNLRSIRLHLAQFPDSNWPKHKEKIARAILKLPNMPFKCQEYERDHFYRRLIVGQFQVFYHVNAANGHIEIHRIYHCKQDIEKKIKLPL